MAILARSVMDKRLRGADSEGKDPYRSLGLIVTAWQKFWQDYKSGAMDYNGAEVAVTFSELLRYVNEFKRKFLPDGNRLVNLEAVLNPLPDSDRWVFVSAGIFGNGGVGRLTEKVIRTKPFSGPPIYYGIGYYPFSIAGENGPEQIGISSAAQGQTTSYLFTKFVDPVLKVTVNPAWPGPASTRRS